MRLFMKKYSADIVLGILIATFASCSARVTVFHSADPIVLHDSECVVSLLSTSNNQKLSESFELDKRATIRIVYQGEGANSDMAPSLVETYHNDCVEFYIDTKGTDRQFRFVWGSSLLTGKSVITSEISFAQGDPASDRYCFEVEFPWRSLGIECPGENGYLTVDCSVIDNDAESRKTQISWFCKDKEIYQGSEKHGQMPLKGLKTICSPRIDGVAEKLWSEFPEFGLDNVIIGKIRDSSDLAAKFRMIWDEYALYVLIDVKDDIKKMAEVLFDRAELLDSSGNIVWRPYLGKTFHAGGALKNRRQEDTLSLNAGYYTLRYLTDESHSHGHWDDVPPTEDFSGVKIYLLEP